VYQHGGSAGCAARFPRGHHVIYIITLRLTLRKALYDLEPSPAWTPLLEPAGAAWAGHRASRVVWRGLCGCNRVCSGQQPLRQLGRGDIFPYDEAGRNPLPTSLPSARVPVVMVGGASGGAVGLFRDGSSTWVRRLRAGCEMWTGHRQPVSRCISIATSCVATLRTLNRHTCRCNPAMYASHREVEIFDTAAACVHACRTKLIYTF
jgi:hypothetical protein